MGMNQDVLFEMCRHEFIRIRAIRRKAEGWNEHGVFTGVPRKLSEDEAWNLKRWQSGNCMEWERAIWEAIPGYPEDTRSCLLSAERDLFIAELFGLHGKAEAIRRAKDAEWASIRESFR